MYSPKFVGRINYKPLVPAAGYAHFRPEKILKRMKREILKQIQDNILQSTFSTAAKKRLAKGMRVTLGPRSVTVEAIDKAFLPLLQGQVAGQMTWLTKAKRPIPIVLDSGKVIFRWATARSMKSRTLPSGKKAPGSWMHPGREARTVIEKARKAARKVIKKRIKKELLKHFRTEMAKALA